LNGFAVFHNILFLFFLSVLIFCFLFGIFEFGIEAV
jgi:hypothetical protein